MEYLKIEPTRFASGERFPVVVSESLMPQFYQNTFLTAELRALSKQYNTLLSAADAIKVLRAWELLEGIDVIARMTAGNFLTVDELDRMVEAMWQWYACLTKRVANARGAPSQGGKVRSLAAYRHRQQRKEASEHVASGTAAGRLVYVASYLRYLGRFSVMTERDATKRHALSWELETMTTRLAARVPEAHGANIDPEYQRLGLTYEVEVILRQVIEPGHPMNPWHKKLQRRNCMIIKIMLGLGLRRGELLNLRVDDIDFRTGEVFIRRLPDNPADPRLYEPNVKTRARQLRMKAPLLAAIREYVTNDRAELQRARGRHDFLVVSSVDGSPLSLSAFNDIFAAVRKKVPGMPQDFCPHLCRHTWNDRFSDYCDKMGIDEERERNIRCRIMGWAPGSQMSLVYTKRSTQAAVDACLLAHQEYITNGRLEELLDEITVETKVR
jgi:integrase